MKNKKQNYVSPKMKSFKVRSNYGFAMSNVAGSTDINDWVNGGDDIADN